MSSYLESQLLETIEAQNTTIKKLRDENKKTVTEALAIIQKHQHAIELGAIAIGLLESKVKKLECEALGRSWDAKDKESK